MQDFFQEPGHSSFSLAVLVPIQHGAVIQQKQLSLSFATKA